QILADPAFEIRTRDGRANIDLPRGEAELDPVARRQRDLGGGDRAIEREAEVELDEGDELAQRRRIERGSRELAQFAQVRAALHHGELVTAGELRVVMGRERQQLAE